MVTSTDSKMNWLLKVIIFIIISIIVSLILNQQSRIRSFSSLIIGMIVSAILCIIYSYFFHSDATVDAGSEVIIIIVGLIGVLYILNRALRDRYPNPKNSINN